MSRRVRPFDHRSMRHTLRFGASEVRLSDADLAQLHDTLERLHAGSDPAGRTLQPRLRRALEEGEGGSPLAMDVGTARQVQLAIYAEESARRPVSRALADARRAAFAQIESSRADA